jgi:hypothetical protein
LDKWDPSKSVCFRRAEKKFFFMNVYNIPEDILRDRTEQSLMQIEGASIARNSLSSLERNFKAEHFSRFA